MINPEITFHINNFRSNKMDTEYKNDVLDATRAILFSPGYLESFLGCYECNNYKIDQDNIIQPRLNIESNSDINIECKPSSSSPCINKISTMEGKIEIPNLENKAHSMRRAIIKLTDKCQMHCIYCANDDGQNKNSQIVPTQVYDILNKFLPQEVEFTGGEPTIDFPLLVDSIKTAKLFSDFVMINTNLELINMLKIQQLERAGLSHIHFALHTMRPEIHKQLRGNEKAKVDTVLTNLNYILRESNLKIVVEFIPMNENYEELSHVYEYVNALSKQYPNRIDNLEIGRLIPIGRANQEMSPSIEKLIETFNVVKKDEIPIETFCFGKKYVDDLQRMGFSIHQCDVGNQMFYFEIDGSVIADNFTGIEISKNFLDFNPTKFVGISCPFR